MLIVDIQRYHPAIWWPKVFYSRTLQAFVDVLICAAINPRWSQENKTGQEKNKKIDFHKHNHWQSPKKREWGNESPIYECKGWFPHSLLRAIQKKRFNRVQNSTCASVLLNIESIFVLRSKPLGCHALSWATECGGVELAVWFQKDLWMLKS